MRTVLLTAIAVIFIFTLTAQVEGAKWEKISENIAMRFYLDVSSITKLPDYHYNAWGKSVVKHPDSDITQIWTYQEYDCNNKKTRTLQFIGYERNGKSSTEVGKGTWSDEILPESHNGIRFTLVCNNYRGNWEKDFETEGYIFYIDWNSMKKLPDNHYMVWEKTDIKDPSSEQDYLINYVEYDCVKKRRRMSVFIGYSIDGSVFLSTYEWRDTDIDRLERICNKLSNIGDETQ